MDVWGMPVHRPSTNPIGKGKAGSELELAAAKNGHHTLQCPPFLNTHGLWPIVFVHLEAIGEARLGKPDLSAGDSVLWVWSTARNPYRQRHSLLQEKVPSFRTWMGNSLTIPLHICPSWEWYSGAMSPHDELNCSQDALSHTGGCLLV